MESKITRIELPNVYGMGTVNSYLVQGSHNSLIDCGEDTDESFEALLAGLRTAGLNIADIDDIYITHAHVDHIGMTNRVAQLADCPVYVSDLVEPWAIDLEANWHRRSQIMINTMQAYLPEEIGKGILGMFQDMSKKIMTQWKPIDPDRIRLFHHGQGAVPIAGESWEVIYAPGHSTTQSCFFHRGSRRLFAADMLLKITPTPVMEPTEGDDQKREKGILTMLDSYERFRALKATTIYPGHYEIFDDAEVKINQQINRIHQRKEQCYSLIAEGTDTLIDIFQALYKGRWHLPAFNMTLAYIDLLDHEERVSISQSPGDIKRFSVKL